MREDGGVRQKLELILGITFPSLQKKAPMVIIQAD